MLLRILLLLLSWHFTTLPAAPSTPNPRSFLEPFDKRWNIQCYHPPPNTYPLVPSDCVRAARNIACGPNIEGLLRFSRNLDWKVPYTWIWNTCSVVIDIVEPGNPTEIASLGMISLRALQLISNCVMNNEFKSGGRTTVGANDLLNVVVTGLARPTNPYPSLEECIATVKDLGLGSGLRS